MGANCSAGLYVYRRVFIWLGAPKSTITWILPFSSTLCFPSEQKTTKCHLKSSVNPALVKPPLPGTRSPRLVASPQDFRCFLQLDHKYRIWFSCFSAKKQILWRGCLCWKIGSSFHRNGVWRTHGNSLFNFRVSLFVFANEFRPTNLQHVTC